MFFKGLDGDLYSCSGLAVAARNRSLVWSAGHCLYDNDVHPFDMTTGSSGGPWIADLRPRRGANK